MFVRSACRGQNSAGGRSPSARVHFKIQKNLSSLPQLNESRKSHLSRFPSSFHHSNHLDSSSLQKRTTILSYFSQILLFRLPNCATVNKIVVIGRSACDYFLSIPKVSVIMQRAVVVVLLFFSKNRRRCCCVASRQGE